MDDHAAKGEANKNESSYLLTDLLKARSHRLLLTAAVSPRIGRAYNGPQKSLYTHAHTYTQIQTHTRTYVHKHTHTYIIAYMQRGKLRSFPCAWENGHMRKLLPV